MSSVPTEQELRASATRLNVHGMDACGPRNSNINECNASTSRPDARAKYPLESETFFGF